MISSRSVLLLSRPRPLTFHTSIQGRTSSSFTTSFDTSPTYKLRVKVTSTRFRSERHTPFGLRPPGLAFTTLTCRPSC